MSIIINTLTNNQLFELIQNSAVGIIPTDTVYGLASLATSLSAVQRLYELKHRQQKPGTIIAASVEQLVDLGIKRRYLKAVEHFWPGAVSIEIPHNTEYLHQGTGRQAFRVVADPAVRVLLERTGPLLTSSANLPGQPPANTFEEAQSYFGDTVDYYVDGKDMSGREPSTVIGIVDDAIVIYRQGAVKIGEDGSIQ